MNAVIVVITFLFVIAFDFIPIIHKQNKKEIIVYSSCLIISFSILFLYSIGIIVPGPSDLVELIIK